MSDTLAAYLFDPPEPENPAGVLLEADPEELERGLRVYGAAGYGRRRTFQPSAVRKVVAHGRTRARIPGASMIQSTLLGV
jgi:hypothetical protein